MSVIITSFKVSQKIQSYKNSIRFYSVARRQPKGFFYDELKFFRSCDVNGNRLRLNHGVFEYKKKLLEFYVSGWDDISKWLECLKQADDVVLCCWCPYSISTKNQILTYNNFVCHTGIIGRIVNRYRHDIDVILDNDHLKLNDEYIPHIYKSLGI